MTQYKVIIYWSADSKAFITEVPELLGCIADGATKQVALKNLDVGFKEWVVTAKSLGRPIPEPKGRLAYA